MKKITKKQRATLKKYELNMQTALYSNYVRAMSAKAVDEVRVVYEEIIGKPYRVTNTCGACVLDLLKRVGQIYFTK